MQHMIMQRVMHGIYVPPLPGFIPPPPLPVGLPPMYTPPPPPPSTPPPLSPSSMDVSVGTASPSSTLSYATYYTPSPLASPQSFTTASENIEQQQQQPVSPSFFADMYQQNGQDIWWDYQHPAASSNDEGNGEDDDDDDVEDDDVVFVQEYQRPNDITPAEGTPEYWSLRLLEAEKRAEAAEQRFDRVEEMLRDRIERTSCAVCTRDLLNAKTLRLPCGHINCEVCLKKISRDANNGEEVKCPQCRRIYVDVNYCEEIIFP